MRRLLPAALALCLAGCGAPKPVRAPDHTVSVTITDFRLHPQVIRVAAGRISFSVRNSGQLPHDFQVRGRGKVRLKIATMLPGESGQGAATLARGDYRMYCALSNHEDLGEYGTLHVR